MPRHEEALTFTRAVLDRIRRGEPGCREVLARHLAPILRARATGHRALRELRRHVDAGDIASEALARFFHTRAFERFEDQGPGSLRRYLFTIVDRVVSDWCRRARRRPDFDAARLEVAAESDGGRPTHPVDHETPSALAAARDLEAAALAVANPGVEQAVVRMLVEQGLGPCDIASLTRRTPASVRGIIFRWRTKLHVLLRRESGRPGTD